MNLYHDSGYFNIENILLKEYPFNFIVGGRGTGKTFGALKYAVESCRKFMFMRRTQSQIDLIAKPEFSPFKSLNDMFGWNITVSPITKYNAGFYMGEDSKLIGYTCALSTVSNLRGFDASDVDLIIFDEFIPERHERPIKNEATALLNAYETINRNRELQGRKPAQLLALANANDLGNAVFLELGLVRIAERMRMKGNELYSNKERGILMAILQGSPISKDKKETALYKLSKGSEFDRMSTENTFELSDYGEVRGQKLSEYKPIVTIGELTIYAHKSNHTYYASTHASGSPVKYGAGETDKARFRRSFGWLWLEYMRNRIIFEEHLCEILFTKYNS